MASNGLSKSDDPVDQVAEGIKKHVTFAPDVEEGAVDEELKEDKPAGNESNNMANYSASSTPGGDTSKGWPEQNLDQLDVNKLTPLDPIIMHRQATLNIGTIGHVAHGKCFIAGTEIRMRDGSLKAVEDISVNDQLQGDDNSVRSVLQTTSGSGQLYRVQPQKGSGAEAYTCNSQHILVLQVVDSHSNSTKLWQPTVDEYLSTTDSQLLQAAHMYQPSTPIQFASSTYLQDTLTRLNGTEPAISDVMTAAYQLGSALAASAKQQNVQLLRAVGMKNKRHVPTAIQGESITNRTAFLAGFVDACGSMVNGCIELWDAQRDVLLSIRRLAATLGINATAVRKQRASNSYAISLFGRESLKSLSTHCTTLTASQLQTIRSGCHQFTFTIEPLVEIDTPYYGFQLDGNARFLLADSTVSHNSTVVKAITGVQTVRFKTELERNITIKLGYANAKIFKCDNEQCKKPGNYRSFGSAAPAKPDCDKCGSKMTLVRHVSFVDCFAPHTLIMMADGSKRAVGTLRRGDHVMGVDGKPRTVASTTQGQKQMYDVNYDMVSPAAKQSRSVNTIKQQIATSSFTCTSGHLLVLQIDTPVEKPQLRNNGTYTVRQYTANVDGTSMQCSIHQFESPADAHSFYHQADKKPVQFEMTAESYVHAPASLKKRAKLFRSGALNYTPEQLSATLATEYQCAEDVAYTLGQRFELTTGELQQLRMQPLSVRQSFISGVTSSKSVVVSNEQCTIAMSSDEQPEQTEALVDIIRSSGVAVTVHTNTTSMTTTLTFSTSDISSPKSSVSVPFNVTESELGNYCGFAVEGIDSRILLGDHIVSHNCPGHDILMATMLNGAAVMDAALLLVAGNEPCPQPQTSEHLAAVEIMKLKNILILQNKIDLVKSQEAAQQYERIQDFIRGTVAESAPIIPISAQLKYNIEVICEYITTKIPVPMRDFTSSPQLIVIRSFDVNKPGEEVDQLKGGVAGGSILKGILRVGQEIEIRPGIVTKDAEGNVKCIPIFSSIVSLFAEHNDLAFAVPGGLIGAGTKIDPTLTRADRLVGQVLGAVGKLPDVFTELEISFFLLRRLLGVKVETSKSSSDASGEGSKSGRQAKIEKLKKDEILMVNIGSTSTGAKIIKVKGDLAKVQLISPVCTSEGEKLALSRRVEKHWRLIGWGKIRKGTKIVSGAVSAQEAAKEAQAASNSSLAADQAGDYQYGDDNSTKASKGAGESKDSADASEASDDDQ